ncbi:MAG: hypothetical protein O2856_04045 [Planctomycetota bacterium]|nr:hypothetical protein [Planctomycetota bacterium]
MVRMTNDNKSLDPMTKWFMGIVAAILVSLGSTGTIAVVRLSTTVAVMQKDISTLSEDDARLESHQSQLSKQWPWLNRLQTEINRMRAKDNLDPIVPPDNH